jgi:hypothetical protein
VEAQGKGWPSLRHAFLTELHNTQRQQAELEQQGSDVEGGEAWETPQRPPPPPPQQQQQEEGACGSCSVRPASPCCNEAPALESVLASMSYDPALDPYCSLSDPPLRIDASNLVSAAALAAPLAGPGLGVGMAGSPAWQPAMAGSYRSSSTISIGNTEGSPSRR